MSKCERSADGDTSSVNSRITNHPSDTQRLNANMAILHHLASPDLDVLGFLVHFFFLFYFVKVSIWMSFSQLPFIILQCYCSAFQFRQNGPAISQTVIAAKSFAGSNYSDYPLLKTTFSHREVYCTHLTCFLRK